ncbi:hypothetical protein [Hymenobacter wooponensis]|uniref:Uncharacterized protein n=1 Tax=Hymenobacter wooponensis TaxID=1525360 RepID=A0A4Z0MC33_9BACT|nr:hypothetical protein [Hymenobacter wooponensis]TGD77302.1 hypothetical protein EU557_23345 [Hymenobacter wooponensis]
MAFSLLLVLFALALLLPVFFLSRPTASATAKVVAVALAVLPAWLGHGINADFAYMSYAWLIPFCSYLPLAGVLLNLARSTIKA